MSNLQAQAIDIKNFKLLNATGLKATKLSDEQAATFKSRLDNVYKNMFTKPVNLEGHLSQQVYADVMVNGKSVATIYNGGAMMTPTMNSTIQNLPSVNNPQGSGQQLAQQRAEDIAKAMGGTVVMAKKAVTQAQLDSAPPIEFKTDYVALENYMREISSRSLSSQTLLDTQLLIQERS